uniref:Uncharacterized protein n=1 Tax=Arundo donax TaxID=35708 RepID=A0A0A8YCQ4_ARUDO
MHKLSSQYPHMMEWNIGQPGILMLKECFQ